MGFALTIVIISGSTTADWPGGSYTEKLPQAFMPIILGTFIAAFRTGRRDAQHNLAESAPLGADQRALARLASLALPVILTVLVAAGLVIASRIEGGFWLGDHPRRTDTALHPFSELLQMPLVVAFVGALGIAIGRARPRLSISLVILSGAALFTMFPGYWLWNIPPAHVFTPVQTQPMFIDLDAATNIEQTPTAWFVEIPGTDERTSHDDKPTRQLVHQPTIIAHDLYLIGLTAVLAGLAVRGTLGRRATWAGAALAVGGVVAQLLVSPL
ncbi:MAG: hypothetical protein ACKV2O_17885 [Acidimicrobiales bacterium]